MMFLEEAVKEAAGLAGSRKLVTVMYFTPGYIDDEQSALAAALGSLKTDVGGVNTPVNVVPVATTDELVAYFNHRSTAVGGDVPIKISGVSIYVHGDDAGVQLGMDNPAGTAKQSIDARVVAAIQPDDFAPDTVVRSFACRTGALRDGTRLAQVMADTWGVTVFAAQRRTRYDAIYGDVPAFFARAAWIPDEMMKNRSERWNDIVNDLHGNFGDHARYGYVGWNPAGALNAPVTGDSPKETPAGWWMFRPSTEPARASDNLPPVTLRNLRPYASRR